MANDRETRTYVSVDQLSTVFGALADPTRRAILARLAEGDLAVRDLAAPFPVSQPAISRHLKVLEGAGLISRSRRATARLSHLEAEPLREATAWLARYQAYWDERFEQLDELLAQLQRRPEPAAGSIPAKAKKARKGRKQEGRNQR
jgi:DNA-binding transcriptional ArsR family regulator